nr:uncharacterized protein LOC126526352 isoform X1 [Dermacentor andersoni]
MDYVIILALFLSPLLSYGLAPTNTAKKNNDHRVKMVKKLLNQKGSLAVSRGKYTQLDYPLCVRSRFEEYSLSGYFHKLIYYEEKEKGSGILGKRHTLRAFFEVKANDALSLLVHAYMSGGFEDHRISGSYDILYADNTCFIVATPRKAISQCLLWRRAAATKAQRAPCRKAFRKLCSQYPGHKFVYAKERCTPSDDL